MEAEGNKSTADGALKKGGTMNLGAVTIEDCLDMYEKKGCSTVVEDGGVSCFEECDEKW